MTSKYLLGASLKKFKEFQTNRVYLSETYKLKAGVGNAFTTYAWSTVSANVFRGLIVRISNCQEV